MSQKIAVFGTGANGSCIAASLLDAGRDVVLIDQWPAHVEAMRANGLKIAMPESEQHLKVRMDIANVVDFDVRECGLHTTNIQRG